ncbi:hypothetical protein YC2023_072250 [Brassica napus]
MRLAKEDYTRAQANHTRLLEYSRFKTTTRIRLIRTLSLTICTNSRTVGKKVNQSGSTPQFKILGSYKGKFKAASVRIKKLSQSGRTTTQPAVSHQEKVGLNQNKAKSQSIQQKCSHKTDPHNNLHLYQLKSKAEEHGPNVLSFLIASSARTREERIRPRRPRTRDSSRPSSARVRLHPRPDRRQQASILLSSKFHPFSGGPVLYLYETKRTLTLIHHYGNCILDETIKRNYKIKIDNMSWLDLRNRNNKCIYVIKCSRIALNRITNNTHLDIDNTRVRRCIRCINFIPYISLKNWHPPLELKRTARRHEVTDS